MKTLICCISFCCLLCGLSAQELKYTHSNNAWDPDSLGNHRVLVAFTGEGNIAKVVIPWRRRDKDPADKKVIVEDVRSHKAILNVCWHIPVLHRQVL